MIDLLVNTFLRPRCVHWKHIQAYGGLGQKVGYIIRRKLGMRTPSADMIGCKHEPNEVWDQWMEDLFKYAANDILATEMMFKNSQYGKMDGFTPNYIIYDEGQPTERIEYLTSEGQTILDVNSLYPEIFVAEDFEIIEDPNAIGKATVIEDESGLRIDVQLYPKAVEGEVLDPEPEDHWDFNPFAFPLYSQWAARNHYGFTYTEDVKGEVVVNELEAGDPDGGTTV